VLRGLQTLHPNNNSRYSHLLQPTPPRNETRLRPLQVRAVTWTRSTPLHSKTPTVPCPMRTSARRVLKEANPRENCQPVNAPPRTGLPRYVLSASFRIYRSTTAKRLSARIPTEKGTLHHRTRGESQTLPINGNRLPKSARRKPSAERIHPQPPITAPRPKQRTTIRSAAFVSTEKAGCNS
jgi:hypothetical protein